MLNSIHKTLDKFRKIPRTSKKGLLSKAVKMLCVIDVSLCIQESLGLNPDWVALSRQF